MHALLAEVPEPMREPRPTHPPERASGDPPPPAAGSALGTYLAIAVALLIVVTVVVVVLIDQQLRRGPEVPDVLRPVPTPPPAEVTTASPVQFQVTPEPVILNLEVPPDSSETLATPTAVPAGTAAPAKYFLYTVQSGDTIAGIASRFGYAFEEIASLNGIDEPFIIQIGESLLIPNR